MPSLVGLGLEGLYAESTGDGGENGDEKLNNFLPIFFFHLLVYFLK